FSFFFSSRRRHTRFSRDWSSDVCSSDLALSVLSFGMKYLDDHQVYPSTKHFYEAYYSDSGQSLLRRNVTLLHCTTEYPTPFEDRSEERRVGKECRSRRSQYHERRKNRRK